MSLAIPALCLALAFIVTAAHFYAEPARWHVGYTQRRIGWRRLADLFLSTSLASYLLPFKLGIPLRIYLARTVTGIVTARLGGIMALDGIVNIGAWLAVTLLVAGPSLAMLVPGDRIVMIAGASVGATLVAALVAYLVARYRRSDAAALAREFRRPLGLVVAISVVDVASYGPRHALLAIAVGLDPGSSFTWASLGIAATFAGIVSGMPMGLLGYDAALALLYHAAGAGPAEIGLILVANRTISIGSAFVLGVPAARRLGIGGGIRGLLKKARELVRAT